MCLKNEIVDLLSKMAVSHFYHNVKLRHAVAPHVLKLVFLNWHSVITNSIIFFKFRI